MRWIDSHCHCTDEIWREEPARLFADLAALGCEALIQGGIDPEDWLRQAALPDVSLTILRVYGLHPWTILDRSEEQLQRDLLTLRGCLHEAEGLGEMGLDFFRGPAPAERAKQVRWFETQLQLADEVDKPCILHVVRAYQEAWHSVKKVLPRRRGLIHSFWASLEQARPFLDAGWLLSPHPRLLRSDPHQILQRFPRSQLVFESDAPFPLPNGGHTTPALALTLLHHGASTWQMEATTLAEQQRTQLLPLFPCLGA